MLRAGKATVLPLNKPAAFRSPVVLLILKPLGPLPGKHRSTRCILIQCGACRRRYGVVPACLGDVCLLTTSALERGGAWLRHTFE